MGKDSLIKSTTKKKTKAKKEEESKKKTTKKAAAKPKKTTQRKKATKPAAKSTAKSASKTTASKAKKTAVKPKAKKVSAAAKSKTVRKTAPAAAKKPKKPTLRHLLSKKFETLPGAPKAKPVAAPEPAFTDSPPIVNTTDPGEAARIKALLSAKFSMDEIKAAAKAPKKETPKAAPSAPESPTPEQPEDSIDSTASPAGDAPVITTLPPDDDGQPLSKTAKIAIAGALALVLLILGISQNNSAKYYIQPKEGALEIWKGRFSPKDKKFFMVLHGVELEQPPKQIYTRNDVFPLIFNYYLDKADTLLDVSGLPDFEGIKSYLFKAQSFVMTTDMKSKVNGRLNSIERMILLYKADVSISKGTKESLKAALKDLKKASTMVANPVQQQEIEQKIEQIKKLQIELKSADK